MLSNYACLHNNSRGRIYSEPLSQNRNPFQRDRDRIIHSASFRRLEYKTQVFVNYESDHFRTRLTHSLEVAQIARAITKKLNLDQDIAEAISLSHDIGHPPFGHSGEDALDYMMSNYGGFDHNAQALKIITKLEKPYAKFDGLNLSYETIDGLIKHNGPLKTKGTSKIITQFCKKNSINLKKQPSLEAQISSLADDITYNNHDIDDGFRANLLRKEDFAHIDLISDAFREVRLKYPNIQLHQELHEVRRIIYSAMVDDVINQTKINIKDNNITQYQDVIDSKRAIVSFSVNMQKEVIKIKRLLSEKIYQHPKIIIMGKKSHKIISDIFTFYKQNPSLMPGFNSKIHDRMEFLSDYISGMTDRFAINHHKQLFDLYSFTPNFK